MKKTLLGIVAILLFCSHDMYLKLDHYFLPPNQSASITLINGTWAESENTIDLNRMLDVSIVYGGKRNHPDSNQWRTVGNSTLLDFQTAAAGTYLAGVSTKARNIEMEAKAFNDYLEHDGVIDMLDWRKANDALGEAATEKYSKHVKTIFQVGDQRSDDWQTVLGYPIEFIPLSNPYHVHPGEKLGFKLLLNGAPLANQLVTIANESTAHSNDHDHHHHGDEDHHHHNGSNQIRTADDGSFAIDINENGKYYIRTIHMVASEEEGLTHESNWATLSFAVNHNQHQHAHHDHSHDHNHQHGTHEHQDGNHEHDHEHEHHHDESAGLPSYAYWLGSLVLIGLLFWYFNRQQS